MCLPNFMKFPYCLFKILKNQNVTDRRTDNVKTVYPPQTQLYNCGVYKYSTRVPTSFGRKYYHFSFLFKQTDILKGIGFIVRNFICISASTILVRARRAPKMYFRSISCISVLGILSFADANRNYRNLAIFSLQFYESRFLFPLF